MTLVIPVACAVRMVKFRSWHIQVLHPDHDGLTVVLPVMGIVIVVSFVYLLCEMQLNRMACCVFALMYCGYIGSAWTQFRYE